ncbi:hypothetical protein NEAUS06_1331 [Nematocida ausubeli]|nr:hypothetical protein NEAUS06_1331 [Nematocida ausubeli]
MHVEIVKGRRVFAVDLLFLLSSIAEVMCIKPTDIPGKKITQSKQITDEGHLDIASRRNDEFLLYAGCSLRQTELFLSTEASLMKTNLFCIAAEFIVTFGLFSTRIVDIFFKRNGREYTDTLLIKEK